LTLVLSCFGNTASAEESKVQVVGSVDVAFKNLSFNPSGVKQTTPLTTINPNIVIAKGRWYSSFSYDGALGPGVISTIESGTVPQVLSMSRSDFLVTVGYRLTDPLSIFGGYLSGSINAVQFGERNVGGVYHFFNQTINYLEQGPFLGVSYSFPVGKKSSLSFSTAYANLAGSLNEVRTVDTVGTTYTADSFGVSGFSSGITLTGELNDSMSYRAGLKLTNYQGNASGGTINEEYTSVFFGVTNYF